MNPTNTIIYYAQNREDLILNSFFPDLSTGTYIDVGASHPVTDNVTKFFYERGWRGLNIEPIQEQYQLLAADRPEDVCLNVGIAKKPGKLSFRQYSTDGLSTFEPAVMQEYVEHSAESTAKFRDYEVDVIDLATAISRAKLTTINFMKVDVEGYEYQVLEGNDWSKYRPEVLCIEANHIKKDWHALLTKHNYDLVFFDGLNEYFVARECSNRAELFSYENTLLLGPTPIPYKLQIELDRARHQATVATVEKEEVVKQVKALQKQLDGLDGGFRHHAKSLVKSADLALKWRLEEKTRAIPNTLHLEDLKDSKSVDEVRRQYILNYINLPKRPIATTSRKGYSALRRLIMLMDRNIKRSKDKK